LKIIYLQKNSYLACKLTVVLLFVYSISFSQTDSCTFFGNKPIFPYYHPTSPSNGKDFYTVKKEFHKIITAQTNFNGIITVNFFINYKGETDFYKTQLCDLNYKPLSITKDIELLCSQILLAVKQTSPWKPQLDEQRNPINSRKFYSFRFNNGKLIEILPK
jgi:hypothetical protein